MKTTKTIAILMSAILLCGNAYADGKKSRDRRSKKELLEQLERLQAQNDSLNKEIFALKTLKVAEDRLVNRLSPSVDVSNENILKDSLTVSEDSDSVVIFRTDVSDEEFMRRLDAMNSIISIPFNATVKNYMLLYAERSKGQMSRILADAEYYFPIIEETMSNYDMPMELKYLAVVESSLRPKAVSRAGARGMWQFMYNMAKAYGLEVSSYVDERYDPYKSVDAAARYLQDAYNAFGDWSLAISAYNCGAGNVNKAIQLAGGKTDFWSIYPYLPRETRGYMPAFVGAMYAMRYSREHGLKAGEPVLPEKVDTIEIHKKLHFKQINEVAGIPLDLLEMLNPQYTHQIIPGDGTYILRLPEEWSERFAKFNNDELYQYKADEFFAKVIKGDDNLVPSKTYSSHSGGTRYTVRKGDTLGKIAARYGVSVNSLKQANGIKGSVIRVGQTLKIPRR